MQAIHAPMTIIIIWRTSEEIYLLWDNEHLKMQAINTKSFEEQGNESSHKNVIYSSYKNLSIFFL